MKFKTRQFGNGRREGRASGKYLEEDGLFAHLGRFYCLMRFKTAASHFPDDVSAQ